MRSRPTALLVGLWLAGACRIEDRTPASGRRDEAALRQSVTVYFDALGDLDWARLRSLFADRATVELRPRSERPATQVDTLPVRGFATADEYVDLLAHGPPAGRPVGVRMLRADLRLIDELASVWVGYRIAGDPGPAWVDHFLYRRIGAGWLIIHLASTALPPGAEP